MGASIQLVRLFLEHIFGLQCALIMELIRKLERNEFDADELIYFHGAILMIISASSQLKFTKYTNRRQTYSSNKWLPTWPDPDELTETGFYSTGDEDEVKCFHCNLGLRQWETTDKPFTVHQEYSPKCFLLRFPQLLSGQVQPSDIGRDCRKFQQVSKRLLEYSETDTFKIVADLSFGRDVLFRVVSRHYLRSSKVEQKSKELTELAQTMEDEGEMPADEEMPIENLLCVMLGRPVDGEVSVAQPAAAELPLAKAPLEMPAETVAVQLSSAASQRMGAGTHFCLNCAMRPSTHQMLPCSHIGLCTNCTDLIKTTCRVCPVCHARIQMCVILPTD